MSESNESSYYEIALTNRQVLVSFVVLLTCVLAAFVSGVWVGREGSRPEVVEQDQVASAEAAPGDLEQLDEFKFFSDQEKGAEPASEPQKDTTLAEDVGSAGAPRQTPPPNAAPPPSTPPPPRAAPPPPRQTPPPPRPAATADPREGFVIQVLSTRDEARANRVLGQLRQGGYTVFLSPVQVGTQVNYRVRVGPFEQRPAADQTAREVNDKYKLDTWVTAASN
ncbi:MAG: SPOR domain-containing protein [bacterium]|nr:SPOR domain-containing protein [bacterium]